MGLARLHLSAVESCVSGSPHSIFFFSFLSDNSGFSLLKDYIKS